MNMAIEDITEIGDEFATYSVYSNSQFYRVTVWESLDPERMGYAEVEDVTHSDGSRVKDEQLRHEMADEIMKFRGEK